MILYEAFNRLMLPSRARLFLEDDFTTGVTTSGSIGTIGWSSSGTISTQSSTGSNLGIIRLDTSSVSGTHARINCFSSSMINPALAATVVWVAKVGTNDANTTIRYGCSNGVAQNPPNDGIYFEKLDGDTNWFVVTRASSSETRVDSGIAVDTNFNRFTYVRSSTGVQFRINNTIVATNTTTIPTTYLSPYVYIINSAAASKTTDVDYFSLLLTGLSR